MSGEGAVQAQGTNDWKTGPFGCFQDKRLCILGFFVPCYVMGKNSEAVGEDCLLTGILTAVGFQFGPVIRWRLRQERHIKGSMLLDVLMYVCIPCCALVQEANEIGWSPKKTVAEHGKKDTDTTHADPTQDMDRQ